MLSISLLTSSLLLYFRWRLIPFQRVHLLLPLLVTVLPQSRARSWSHILQLRNMFFDQHYRCRPCRFPKSVVQLKRSHPRAQVASTPTPPLSVCRGHCTARFTRRLPPIRPGVTVTSHPLYLATTPAPPGPCSVPEL